MSAIDQITGVEPKTKDTIRRIKQIPIRHISFVCVVVYLLWALLVWASTGMFLLGVVVGLIASFVFGLCIVVIVVGSFVMAMAEHIVVIEKALDPFKVPEGGD